MFTNNIHFAALDREVFFRGLTKRGLLVLHIKAKLVAEVSLSAVALVNDFRTRQDFARDAKRDAGWADRMLLARPKREALA